MSFPSAFTPAPAKLNLFLRITGRRDDGYHEIQTVYQLLDYGDLLGFESAPPGTLSLHLAADSPCRNVPLESNLILRAARKLWQVAATSRPGARIRLFKRIPVGAGLGGGSSDAAATLVALNRLWQLGLERTRLMALGLQLGADVPLFIGGQSAWAEGIGERLAPISLEPRWYLVITPHRVVSTAAIFAHENLTRNSPAIRIADFLAGRAGNDCETVTRALHPEVDEALDWLQTEFGRAGIKVGMSGTGAGVFAAFPNQATALEALAKFRETWQTAQSQQSPPHPEAFVARGVESLHQLAFHRRGDHEWPASPSARGPL